MDKNKQHTLDIFEKLKGQHILISNSVLRFIGIGEDDDDYLYILWDGRKVSYHTILERMTELKGKIDDKDYNEIVRLSKLNHIDSQYLCTVCKSDEEKQKNKDFSMSIKKDIEKEISQIRELKLLADICWEIG